MTGPEVAGVNGDADGRVLRLISVARRLDTAEKALDRLVAERSGLMLELADRGWSENKLAWVLRVTQVRAHQLLVQARKDAAEGEVTRG